MDRENQLQKYLFFIILVLKIIFAFSAGSYFLNKLFTPFINWFVISHFQNPWQYFYQLDMLKMFPYPTVMLWIMAVPRLLFSPWLSDQWQSVTPLHLGVMRLPLLAADLALFLILKKLVRNHKKLFWVYWCSPIIFFVNYLYGQLDIIPTAIFMGALYFVLNRKFLTGLLLVAVAAAAKTHILIALPFLIIFIYKQKVRLWQLAGLLVAFLSAYLALLWPYLHSPAFIQMVFKAAEQQSFYEFLIPVSQNLSIVVCPTIIFLLWLKFASYPKLNNEILMMFLGVVFSALVVFVTARPGWFIWSLPFLIYFYVQNDKVSKAPFVLYNLIYFVYFAFLHDNPHLFLYQFMDKSLVDNLLLSLILSSIAFTTVWMYQLGIEANEQLKIKSKPLLIGIGGDSSTGKHTLYHILQNLLGAKLCIPLYGDDMHKWERGDIHWQSYTHLNPASNRLHTEIDTALSLKDQNFVSRSHYNHQTGKFDKETRIDPSKFIFFIGLHPFYLKKMRELIDFKIYLEPDEKLRKFWKINRDTAERGYTKQKSIKQIESRLIDGKKYILPQKEYADLIIRYLPDQKLTAKDKPKIKVQYLIENSLDIENLAALLRSYPINLVHEQLPDLKHQSLIVSGKISAENIKEIATALQLHDDELLLETPVWLADLDGVTQLIFTVIYHEKMKTRLKP